MWKQESLLPEVLASDLRRVSPARAGLAAPLSRRIGELSPSVPPLPAGHFQS